MVDTYLEALAVLKGCRTEAQRQEYLIALALMAPSRSRQRDKEGMIRRVAERLDVKRGRCVRTIISRAPPSEHMPLSV